MLHVRAWRDADCQMEWFTNPRGLFPRDLWDKSWSFTTMEQFFMLLIFVSTLSAVYILIFRNTDSESFTLQKIAEKQTNKQNLTNDKYERGNNHISQHWLQLKRRAAFIKKKKSNQDQNQDYCCFLVLTLNLKTLYSRPSNTKSNITVSLLFLGWCIICFQPSVTCQKVPSHV